MNEVTLQLKLTEPVTITCTVFGRSWTLEVYPVPVAPTGLIVSTDYQEKIVLQWSPVQYALDYRVLRDGTLVAKGPETTYVDANVAPGETHGYQVYAQNATGVSPGSITVQGRTALPPHDVQVQVGNQFGTSNLRVGIIHADNALLWGDATAISRAKTALQGTFAIHKVFIQGWGAGRIWPYDGGPTGTLPTDPKTIAFGTLDRMMNNCVEMGGQTLLAFFMLPWWMRARLDGSFLTPKEEYSESGRLRTDCIQQWGVLVERIALRYLIAPYHVRDFEVGAEPKGFYTRRDGKAQSWEWDDYPGTPGKADMGYTAFYKYTVGAVLRAAAQLDIPREDLRFWGPYSATPSRTVASVSLPPVGHPLRDRPWGYAMKEWVEFTSKFLDLWRDTQFPLDGLMVDGGNANRDDTPMDIWVASTKFLDIMTWLRSETARIGYPDLPIAWGEFYPNSQVGGTEEYRALVRLENMRLMMLLGIDYLMAWQAQGSVPGPTAQLYTDPHLATGGVALPQLEALALMHRLFPAGTPLYTVETDGTSIRAAASDSRLLLVNIADSMQRVLVGNRSVYEVPGQGWLAVDR